MHHEWRGGCEPVFIVEVERAPHQRSVCSSSCIPWIHRLQTDLEWMMGIIWHVLCMQGGGAPKLSLFGYIRWSVGPLMTGWAHHFLLEGVPTCHSGSCMLWLRRLLRCGPRNPCALIFHPWTKTQLWSEGENWLWETSHGSCHLGMAWRVHSPVGRPPNVGLLAQFSLDCYVLRTNT
jgi:hypothetical protein